MFRPDINQLRFGLVAVAQTLRAARVKIATGGGFAGEGTSPPRMIRCLGESGSGTGTADNRA